MGTGWKWLGIGRIAPPRTGITNVIYIYIYTIIYHQIPDNPLHLEIQPLNKYSKQFEGKRQMNCPSWRFHNSAVTSGGDP